MVNTPILNIPQVATNQNLKETTINTGIAILEAALNDSLAVNLTAGNVTLTTDQYTRFFMFRCSGHAVARNLDTPVVGTPATFTGKRMFVVSNEGSANVVVRPSGSGSGTVTVPAGKIILMQNDGTTIRALSSGVTLLTDLSDVDMVSVAPLNGDVLQYNGTDWVPGSFSASSFLGLTDTPANYTAAAGKFVRVNSTPNGLEFHTLTIADIPEFPSFSAGEALMVLQVNGAGDGLEWVSLAAATTPALTELDDVDQDASPTDGQIIYWDVADTEWKFKDNTILTLTDTPDDYTAQAGKILVVKSTEDGVEFANVVTGALSIDYSFSTTTADADPGPGNLRLDNATQNAATTIRVDLLDKYGNDWSAVLLTLDDSTNTVKGLVRLFDKADPTKFIYAHLTALASPSGYKNIAITVVASSTASPFAASDVITLEFSRAGDVGGTGSIQTLLDGISTTQGVVLYYNGTDWVALSPGTDGKVLTTHGAAANPTWEVALSDIQTSLDTISTTHGVVLYYNGTNWVALSPGTDGKVLTTHGAAANPTWETGSSDIQALLDGISTTQGTIIYYNGTNWVALAPGTADYVLTAHGASADPTWEVATGGGGGGGPVTVSSLSSAYTNTLTTGTEIAGLTQTLVAGRYTFKASLIVQTNNSPTGVKFGVNYTGTATAMLSNMRFIGTGVGSITGIPHGQTVAGMCEGASSRAETTAAPDLGPTSAFQAANVDHLITVEGAFVVTNGGDFEIWCGCETGSDTITVGVGSSLEITCTSGAGGGGDIQTLLDGISTNEGDILYYNGTDWVALAPGTAGDVLTSGGAGDVPTWETPTGGGGSPVTVSHLNSDHTNATTTGTEVAGLTQTLTAGTYAFKYSLIVQSNVAGGSGGMRFGVNYTGTTTRAVSTLTYYSTGTSSTSGIATSSQGGLVEHDSSRLLTTTAPDMAVPAFQTVNVDTFTTIEGVIVVSNGGDLELWVNIAATSGQTVSVESGSSLAVTKMA